MGYIATGVPNLDTILGGGLPESYLVLITGGPGTGKTVLVQQMASRYARETGKVLYVTALSEAHSTLVAHLSGFTFFDRSLLGERIIIINVFPVARQGLTAVTTTIVRTLKDHKISLLVFDGFRSLRDIHANEREVRAFSYELAGTLAAMKTTSLFTSESAAGWAEDAPEVRIADGLLSLSAEWTGTRFQRTLEVVKLRGAHPLRGPHFVCISKDGLAVYPRPESVYTAPSGAPPEARLSLGLAKLDEMLGGGLPAGSSTYVLGDPGVGKTLLGLHFLAAGLAAGESGIFVGFQETPDHLLAKAATAGLDLRAALASGSLRILHFPAIELAADRVAWELWAEAERLGARRVVIDGATQLQRSVGAEREAGFTTAVMAHLSAKGATVMLLRTREDLSGFLPPAEESPLEAVADNLITMRLIDVEGKLRRALAVVKMRDSAHDNTVRVYTIDERGLQIGGQFKGEDTAARADRPPPGGDSGKA